MLLEESISILDKVLNTEYANEQKVNGHDYYIKERLTSVSVMRMYEGKIDKNLNWYIYMNFGFKRRYNSKYDESLHIKLKVNDEQKRDKILNAAYLYQDHLNIDKTNRDIGI
jgi:hypothetical protein